MKKPTILIALFTLTAAMHSYADPAIGPSISLDSALKVYKPVQNDKRLEQRAVLSAPKNLRIMGTHGSIDAGTPVQRTRGSAGSLNIMVDMQARPSF